MKNFIDELRWRGMLQDSTPEIEAHLLKEITSGYVGFDPTAASLHIGNLATIMLLVHLQRCGHKPYALVGGATGMVGDPSGKSSERQFLDENTIRYNENCIKTQLSKFLDFNSQNNAAEIVNNYDWFKEMGFLQFLREAGKFITVNYMMAKDSVQKRLETGISFTEFSYQLLQGYDFYWLYANKNVKLQMGGSDQWGNIVTGTEFIRRKASGDAFAVTCPLITKSDGSKFGKSESGNIWLDPEMTSPYKFYQFWLNVSDEEASRLIRVFTLLEKNEIEGLEAAHAQTPHLRLLQKAIAEDVTVRVHSQTDYETAVKASEILFGNAPTEALKQLDEKTLLSVLEGVPQIEISTADFDAETIINLLSTNTKSEIFASKGEAKKMIGNGGVFINKNKINDTSALADLELLNGKYLLVQRGKKNYYLVVVG